MNIWVLLSLLISSVLYGFDGNLVKSVGVEDAILNSGLRAVGAVVFSSVFFLVVKRRLPKFKMNLWFSGAVVSSVLCCFAFVYSIGYIRVDIVLTMFHAAILWLTLIKWYMGEPIDQVDKTAGYGVFAGLVALCYQRELVNEVLGLLTGHMAGYGHLVGFIAGIFAGMAFAGYLYSSGKAGSKSLVNDWAPLEVFACSQFIIAISVISIGMVRFLVLKQEFPAEPWQVRYLLSEGVVYGIAYAFLSYALFHGEVHVVSVFIGGLEPIAGFGFGYLIHGEDLRWQIVLGFVIVTSALLYQGFAKRKETEVQES